MLALPLLRALAVLAAFVWILLAPPEYQRRQTLANAERFVVPELAQWDEKISGAQEKIKELEYRLFLEVRDRVLEHLAGLQQAGSSAEQAMVQVNRMIDQQAFTRAADDIFAGSAAIFLLLIGMIWFTKRPARTAGGAAADAGGAH